MRPVVGARSGAADESTKQRGENETQSSRNGGEDGDEKERQPGRWVPVSGGGTQSSQGTRQTETGWAGTVDVRRLCSRHVTPAGSGARSTAVGRLRAVRQAFFAPPRSAPPRPFVLTHQLVN